MWRRLRTIYPSPKCLPSRWCTGFVSRMRYVNRLKEDDAACLSALHNGHIFLFHRLSPLLQRTQRGTLRPPALITSDVQSVLERLGSDDSLLKRSVLIGCSEQNHARFCLDVGKLDQVAVEQACEGNFLDLRKSLFLLTAAEAAPLAKLSLNLSQGGLYDLLDAALQGQALLRWHQTNRFCSATGQPTQRNQAGSHRVCSSNGIVYYAKMSPVVIVLVSDGRRCLLGRQPSFPRGMYSALAGFCDMGESLEEALCREVAEEVGLELQSISYSSSQHWPFPHSSLMLGCHATVSPAHTQLQVDHAELEDARWFSLEEITSALKLQTPPQRRDPPALWLPPKQAIAHHLITEWTKQQLLKRTDQNHRPGSSSDSV